MYLDMFPVSYFLIRRVRTPGASDGLTGVYGRMTGLPLASTRASGSEALTRRQDATGIKEASPLGSSKTNLEEDE